MAYVRMRWENPSSCRGIGQIRVRDKVRGAERVPDFRCGGRGGGRYSTYVSVPAFHIARGLYWSFASAIRSRTDRWNFGHISGICRPRPRCSLPHPTTIISPSTHISREKRESDAPPLGVPPPAAVLPRVVRRHDLEQPPPPVEHELVVHGLHAVDVREVRARAVLRRAQQVPRVAVGRAVPERLERLLPRQHLRMRVVGVRVNGRRRRGRERRGLGRERRSRDGDRRAGVRREGARARGRGRREREAGADEHAVGDVRALERVRVERDAALRLHDLADHPPERDVAEAVRGRVRDRAAADVCARSELGVEGEGRERGAPLWQPANQTSRTSVWPTLSSAGSLAGFTIASPCFLHTCFSCIVFALVLRRPSHCLSGGNFSFGSLAGSGGSVFSFLGLGAAAGVGVGGAASSAVPSRRFFSSSRNEASSVGDTGEASSVGDTGEASDIWSSCTAVTSGTVSEASGVRRW